jgi:hypothetical protein
VHLPCLSLLLRLMLLFLVLVLVLLVLVPVLVLLLLQRCLVTPGPVAGPTWRLRDSVLKIGLYCSV